MTTKDYIAVAVIIQQNIEYEAEREGPAEQRNTAIVAIQRVANELADLMERDNSLFKRDVFMRACGF